MLLLLLACGFSAASRIADSDSGSGATASGTSSSGTTPDTTVTDTTDPTTTVADADGDGWDAEHDCDDRDPGVHPGVEDGCNGVDDDCDGAADEDDAGDAYEPNDSFATDLGSLEDDPEQSLVATLSTDDDVDRYSFSIVDDNLDFFTVNATLSNIPSGAVWTLTLERTHSDAGGSTGTITSVTGSDSISLSMGDDFADDQSGIYELIVTSLSGTDCGQTYLLGVSQ